MRDDRRATLPADRTTPVARDDNMTSRQPSHAMQGVLRAHDLPSASLRHPALRRRDVSDASTRDPEEPEDVTRWRDSARHGQSRESAPLVVSPMLAAVAADDETLQLGWISAPHDCTGLEAREMTSAENDT